jgi:D-alanyl-D-alanine carboxypeptidase/D-alanyl-D-alanine-endopeptidase (penicillin-binding protein 4)
MIELALAMVVLGASQADQAAVYEMTPQAMDVYLTELRQREADFGARVADVAFRSLGTPYADGPLGEGPEGKYDQDPLVDFARVDCVTFVEQTLALAAARCRDEAMALLQQIRYEDGVISFETRNHFMVSDWIENNTFCKDVSQSLGVSTERLTRTISRRGFFERVDAPELGHDTPDHDVRIAYIPAAQAAAAEGRMPSPALVVFIGKVEWLFALHCGLCLLEEGELRLIHASSKAGKVVSEDFNQYLSESTRYIGFTVYRLEQPGARTPPDKKEEADSARGGTEP